MTKTDREMLIRTQAEISHHLESTCPPEEPVDPVPPDGPILIPPEKEGSPPKGTNWEGWIYSVPYWKGENPVPSDGFQRYADDDHRQHLGWDICFRNDGEMVPNIPENTKHYHMPSNEVPMLAMGPGNIWFAGLTNMGWTVKIDHHDYVGFPLNTYYTHMSEMFVAPWAEGGGGQVVSPGMQLGYIGNSPAGPNDINHCHVELLDYSNDVESGRVNRALDPADYLPYFSKLVLPQPKVGLAL